MAGTRAGITEVRVGRGTPWAAPMLSMLPQAVLNEMLLTGEMLPVERLHALGFLNHLEPDGAAVRARALALAELICRNAPLSILAAKHCVRAAAALGADEGFKVSKEFHRGVYESEDAQEGPRAFAEKRAPVWKGR
jgi:enoyl-CoA hydratase/carnithine racemase